MDGMRRMMTILLCFVFLLAACAAPEVAEPAVEAAAEVPTAVPVAEVIAPTAVPTPVPPTKVPAEAIAEPPTAVPAPTLEPTAETAVGNENVVNVIAGRTDDGTFFLGDPNAPLTVIDYSDFL